MAIELFHQKIMQQKLQVAVADYRLFLELSENLPYFLAVLVI